MNKRQCGSEKEELAAAYLSGAGYLILEKNFRNRFGEIDIVAMEGRYLVFVEVKYRRDNRMGYPEEAVDRKKQRIICRVAEYYLIKNRKASDTPCRFDVVSIDGNEIRLYRNAFLFCR